MGASLIYYAWAAVFAGASEATGVTNVTPLGPQEKAPEQETVEPLSVEETINKLKAYNEKQVEEKKRKIAAKQTKTVFTSGLGLLGAEDSKEKTKLGE